MKPFAFFEKLKRVPFEHETESFNSIPYTTLKHRHMVNSKSAKFSLIDDAFIVANHFNLILNQNTPQKHQNDILPMPFLDQFFLQFLRYSKNLSSIASTIILTSSNGANCTLSHSNCHSYAVIRTDVELSYSQMLKVGTS